MAEWWDERNGWMHDWLAGWADMTPMFREDWLTWAWSKEMLVLGERQAGLSKRLTRPDRREEMADLAVLVAAAGIRGWGESGDRAPRFRVKTDVWGWDGTVRVGAVPWWNGRGIEWVDALDWMRLKAEAYWSDPVTAERGRKVKGFAAITAAARIPHWSVDPVMPETAVMRHAAEVWDRCRVEALDRAMRGLLVPLIESGSVRHLDRREVEAAAEGEMVSTLARHFAGNAEGRWLCRVCAEDGGRWLLVVANKARLPVLWLGVADQVGG